MTQRWAGADFPQPGRGFAIGGGAGWYFKIYRPQRQQAAAPEDDYEEEMDAYNDFEDDGPPWDEDDPEPEEDNV